MSTDLKKIQKDILQLSSRNSLLEKILSTIQGLVYVRDIDLKFLMVNTTFENYMGKKAKDILGKTDFDLFPKNLAKKMTKDDLEVINSDCAKLDIEENITLPDGRNVWLIANKTPYHDEDGKVCGIIGISNDITEFKKKSNQIETILDGFPYMAWLKDKVGRYLAVNEHFAKAISKSKKEIMGKTDLDIYPEKDAKRFIKDDLEIMKQKKPKTFKELAYIGNLLKLHETRKSPVLNEKGVVIGITGYARDISKMQKSLFDSKKQADLFYSIVDNIPSMLFVKDAEELKFKMVNKATEELLGLSRKEMIGKTDYDIFPKEQADFFIKKDRETLCSEGFILIEEEKITSNNKKIILSTKKIPIVDKKSNPIYLLGISEDITEKRRLEKVIQKLAYFDKLTGFPNRNLFKERFIIVAEHARRHNKKMMVVMLDFDKFKVVNDEYGHEIGDKLLKSFANKLKKLLRKADTVSRFGGDEFVMVLGDFSNTKNMEKSAKKILGVFKQPFKIGRLKISINGSMGISVFPDDSLNQSELIKFADFAMYEAKINNGDKYKFYLSTKKIVSH